MPEDNRQDIFMLLTSRDGKVAVRGDISRNGQLGWLKLDSISLDQPRFGRFGRSGSLEVPTTFRKGFSTIRAVDKATAEIFRLSTRSDPLGAVVEFVAGDGAIRQRLTAGGVLVSGVQFSNQTEGVAQETASYAFETMVFS